MKIIGVTGGIGMGKSTAGKLLQKHGHPVVDTDAIAHQLVQPGSPALKEITARFGSDLIDASTGALRRDELAKIVFADDAARTTLESILHPRIRAAWHVEADKRRSEGIDLFFVLIPLLFETGAKPEFDATICVACSDQTQKVRLRERNWSDDHIQKRIAAQLPVQKKMDASDFVLWTDTTLEIHDAQLRTVLQQFCRPCRAGVPSRTF